MTCLSLIVAVSENGVIGRDGGLPWHLSADLRRFKQLTMGHTLIMGRKTFESIGRKLPGRTSIIISKQSELQIEGCHVVADWTAAAQLAAVDSEAFVMGGRQIYELALPHVERMYWTHVEAAVDGDVQFPSIDWTNWKLLSDEPHAADERNDHPFRFRVYERSSPD